MYCDAIYPNFVAPCFLLNNLSVMVDSVLSLFVYCGTVYTRVYLTILTVRSRSVHQEIVFSSFFCFIIIVCFYSKIEYCLSKVPAGTTAGNKLENVCRKKWRYKNTRA